MSDPVPSVVLDGPQGRVVRVRAFVDIASSGLRPAEGAQVDNPECRDRVYAAIRNSGERWPYQPVTFTVAGAALRELGGGGDLALACAVLANEDAEPDIATFRASVRDTVLVGELSPDGRLRPVAGLVPRLLAARETGKCAVIVPAANLPEAASVTDLVTGLCVLGAETLTDVVAWLRGQNTLPGLPPPAAPVPAPALDLSDVAGLDHAKTALEIAAAGGHHLLFLAPPGSGATMLAHRLPGLLPPLEADLAATVAAIRSYTRWPSRQDLADLASRIPPLIAPHPSSSMLAVLGGVGARTRPGAVSLAHHGVLFLDTATEFPTTVLESLRPVLDEGEVRLAGPCRTVAWPARFQLVIAAAPCPCGTADIDGQDCVCSDASRRRHRARLRPLHRLIDLTVPLPPPAPADPPAAGAVTSVGESSATVQARVITARAAAVARWAALGRVTNAVVPSSALGGRFRLPAQVCAPLEDARNLGLLTAGGAERVLRVSWTLADLAGAERPDRDMVEQALAWRNGWTG